MWFPDSFQALRSLSQFVDRWVTRSVHEWTGHHRHQLPVRRGPSVPDVRTA